MSITLDIEVVVDSQPVRLPADVRHAKPPKTSYRLIRNLLLVALMTWVAFMTVSS